MFSTVLEYEYVQFFYSYVGSLRYNHTHILLRFTSMT